MWFVFFRLGAIDVSKDGLCSISIMTLNSNTAPTMDFPKILVATVLAR